MTLIIFEVLLVIFLGGCGDNPPGKIVYEGETPTTSVTLVASSTDPTGGLSIGGFSLIVHGEGFDSTVTVTVGGNSCTSVTLQSALKLTCQYPAGTVGAQDVVLVKGAQVVTLSSSFTYRTTPTWDNDINPLFFTGSGRCLGCHGAGQSGGVDFDAYSEITANSSGSGKLVDTASPATSRIYIRTNNDDMPTNASGRPKLTANEKATLLDWITAGAPEN